MHACPTSAHAEHPKCKKLISCSWKVKVSASLAFAPPDLHFIASNGDNVLLCPGDKAECVERQLKLWGGAEPDGGDVLPLGAPAELQANQPLRLVCLCVPLPLPAIRTALPYLCIFMSPRTVPPRLCMFPPDQLTRTCFTKITLKCQGVSA